MSCCLLRMHRRSSSLEYGKLPAQSYFTLEHLIPNWRGHPSVHSIDEESSSLEYGKLPAQGYSMESLNWRGHPSVHSIDLDFHASYPCIIYKFLRDIYDVIRKSRLRVRILVRLSRAQKRTEEAGFEPSTFESRLEYQ